MEAIATQPTFANITELLKGAEFDFTPIVDDSGEINHVDDSFIIDLDSVEGYAWAHIVINEGLSYCAGDYYTAPSTERESIDVEVLECGIYTEDEIGEWELADAQRKELAQVIINKIKSKL